MSRGRGGPVAAWSAGTLEKLDVGCRYLLLNLLWAAACAPLVTAPAATRALLETTRDWAAGSDEPAVRTFARHLRRGALRTTGVAVVLGALGALLALNYAIAAHAGEQRTVLVAALTAIAVPYAILAANFLPANLGRDEGLAGSLKATLVHVVTRPGAAVGMVLLAAAVVVVVYTVPIAVLFAVAPAARAAVVLARTPLAARIHPTGPQGRS